MKNIFKKYLIILFLSIGISLVYADKEQFVVNLDDPYAYFSRDQDKQTQYSKDFLVIYDAGKENKAVLVNDKLAITDVELPKDISNKGEKLDQLVNIGYNNILILTTNEQSNSNFAYIFSINDLLDEEKSKDFIKLKLPNGYNPTITYNGENWSNHIAQYFTFAVTEDKLGSSLVSVYLLQSSKNDNVYSDFKELNQFKMPNISAKHIELGTISSPNPTPGRGYDFLSTLIYKNDDTNDIKACILTPGLFNDVKCNSINETGNFENPTLASLLQNNNVAIVANATDTNNIYTSTFDKQSFEISPIVNIRNQGNDIDAAALDISPNNIANTENREYIIAETFRTSENSVGFSRYSYKKEVAFMDSVVIDKL